MHPGTTGRHAAHTAAFATMIQSEEAFGGGIEARRG
jgi:hypothetical protein